MWPISKVPSATRPSVRRRWTSRPTPGMPGGSPGLDRAPVRVDVTTEGVKSALSVPVVALVGTSGGGFAVEVVRDGARRELVAVQVGLFDTTDGRVEVEGDLDVGDRVVVPSP